MPTSSSTVQGLHKSFGQLEVLRGIDLTVREHEVVCLIGASGSGKSTLLRCINRLEPIDAGRILLDGRDITGPGVDVDRVRRRIGIVFQAFNLFPHMSVLDNVTLGPRKALHRPREARPRRMRWRCSARFGLADKARDYPGPALGRAAAAGRDRARAGDAAASCCSSTRSRARSTRSSSPRCSNLLRELARSGMTMVIATHEMGFARDVANRVCFLDAGRILEQGPPAADLPRRPRRSGRSSSCTA